MNPCRRQGFPLVYKRGYWVVKKLDSFGESNNFTVIPDKRRQPRRSGTQPFNRIRWVPALRYRCGRDDSWNGYSPASTVTLSPASSARIGAQLMRCSGQGPNDFSAAICTGAP